MNRFYESLTENERALLSHLAMDYLDNALGEKWDEGKERVENIFVIEGKDVAVQSFRDVHYHLKTFTIQGMETDLDEEQLTDISRLANYKVKNRGVYLHEYHQPAYGTLLANQSNGSFTLFDHPIETQYAISLEFSDAHVSGDLDGSLKAGDTIRVSGGKNLLTVYLAPEQYVRFVRSQSVKVPCTISRRAGYLNDKPDASYLVANKEGVSVYQSTQKAIQPLVALVEQISDLLESGKMTSVKRLTEVEALLEEAEGVMKASFDEVQSSQVDAVSEIQQNFMGRMMDHIEREVEALPPQQKQMMLTILKDVAQDL